MPPEARRRAWWNHPTPPEGVLEQRSFLIKIAACCSGGTAPNWGLRPRSPAGELAKLAQLAVRLFCKQKVSSSNLEFGCLDGGTAPNRTLWGYKHFVFGPGAFRLIINYNKKNKKWKPRHLREEDVNKYEKPCQVASATYIDSREKTNTIYNLWISSRVNPVI